MTSQQLADELLAVFQAARREQRLADYYAAERNAGTDRPLACERMHFHAKRTDAAYEADLEKIRKCIGRTS
jgi:hypothetical protein